MSLPFMREYDYSPVVLALDPSTVAGYEDRNLLASIPGDVRVHRVRGVSAQITRLLGLRNPALRGFTALARAGEQLIRNERIDLVYFSTTAFPVMTLGRYWRMRLGVPYLIDLQDPWVNEYYARTGVRPPGGRLRYGIVNALARVLEPATLRRASHVISVSPAYPPALCARYPWLRADRFTVLPFGAPERDFETLGVCDITQRVFDPADGHEHWVYAGAARTPMLHAVTAFFEALQAARLRDPARYDMLRVHFVGTDYAADGRASKMVEGVAAACGVGDLVDERAKRIPYFEALRCLRDADALIVPGSDDPAYTASKLYPYILANKPLLAVCHERSSIVDIMTKTRAGTVVGFRTGEPTAAIAARITDQWFAAPRQAPTTDWAEFRQYTAREMTRRQCAIFDRVLREAERS